MKERIWHVSSSNSFKTDKGEKVVRFEVTGKTVNGKRFKIATPGANAGDEFYVRCINLWSGTRWAVLESGRRIKI